MMQIFVQTSVIHVIIATLLEAAGEPANQHQLPCRQLTAPVFCFVAYRVCLSFA